jgi:hypothetical protein
MQLLYKVTMTLEERVQPSRDTHVAVACGWWRTLLGCVWAIRLH